MQSRHFSERHPCTLLSLVSNYQALPVPDAGGGDVQETFPEVDLLNIQGQLHLSLAGAAAASQQEALCLLLQALVTVLFQGLTCPGVRAPATALSLCRES